ncbi:MAG: YciI family protein [Streptosporangiaceae bacterium]
MAQYLISVYQPDTNPPPPDVLGPIMEQVAKWRSELEAAGAWVFTGGLQPPSTATVLRVRDGEVVITDGPFTEGKEHLGGFTVIRAADLDEALRWSQQFAEIAGLPVEVRPLVGTASN